MESKGKELKERFVEFTRYGVSIRGSAKFLGIRPQTIYGWLKSDSILACKHKAAVAACVIGLLNKLRKLDQIHGKK